MLVVDYKSDRLDGAEPAELTEAALLHPAAGVRAGRAALGGRAGGGGVLLPRAPGRAGDVRSTGRPTRPASSASCSSSRRAWSRAASSPRPSPTAALCGDCPGRPALCSWDAERTLADAGPRVGLDAAVQPARSVRPSRRTFAAMPLCFIEPQEAIRVVADSVGREARRQLLGEVVRAWVDEIPDDELAGPLRQGRRGARRRRPVDAGGVARVARGRPADRQQGVPARRRSRASASTGARRCGSPRASAATTPSRPASARSRRSTPCCPGCPRSARWSWRPRPSSSTAGTAWARQLTG